MEIVGEAVLEKIIGELIKPIFDVGKKAAAFGEILKRVKSILKLIEPTVHQIKQSSGERDRPKEESEKQLIQRYEEGKKLIQNYYRAHWLFKNRKYEGKITAFYESLILLFKFRMPLEQFNTIREILALLQSQLKSGTGEVSGQIGYLGSGDCYAPEPPAFTVGLDVPLREVKELLFKESVVVVSAPGGCGKTTLVQKLCQDPDVKGKFKDNIFFVTVSKAPNIKLMVRELFEHNHRPVPEFQTDQHAIKELKRLLTEQAEKAPVLLVLDDVWGGPDIRVEPEFPLQEFKKFEIPEFRILVTSRYKFPGFGSAYKLNLLHGEEAMKLFRHLAFPTDGDFTLDEDFDEDLVKEIVKRCGGFPLALQVVARSLCGLPVEIWKSRLLEWSEGQSILESGAGLLDCLQSSLASLKDKLKECFMDLGSFPEDKKIPVTALIDMWAELYKPDKNGVHAISRLIELSLQSLLNLVVTSDKTLSRQIPLQSEGLSPHCNPPKSPSFLFDVVSLSFSLQNLRHPTMSYAAYKMMHWPTGIENCASGFVTHSRADFAPQIAPIQTDDLESEWPAKRQIGPLPNLIVTAANILEVYMVRVQEDDSRESRASAETKRGGVMAGISGAALELVCQYRLHGNVETMTVLPSGGGDNSRRRDSIILAFQDAKISVLEFDDSIHGLRTSSMHCFEGPEWFHLKRGHESFARGPLVKVDPQGRCSGVLVYGLQMIILKASQAGYGLVGDEEALSSGSAVSARVESSYVISLRDLDMKHVKDFTFVHGYIEPVMVILHERELTWAGRVSWKHHTCMISALSISTTLKQHPLIWSAVNLPHDAYKLLPVPSPIGGVVVISANSIHYHSQSASCALALNNYAVSADNSQEMPRSSFSVELDAANATWLSNDVAMLSTKTGELLLLTLVYDGRVVHRLDLSKSRASVLTSGIAAIGNSLFFLGSRLGDSLLVQFTSILSSSVKEEVGDIEGDVPSAKRLRKSSSDALQDMVNGEELSLYGSAPNSTETSQKTFSFSVRDSFINVGPLKDFAYGLRINADPKATGIAKQSNYELVCCSGHGKNGALCILQQSIRPEMITEVELPGCKGIWTVYHKNTRGHNADSTKMATKDDEYHAYLIISLESRTMVLETADLLGEVTESVDYYVQGCTISAGNLFGRRRVVQVYARGARILDGAFMTQDLPISESSTVLSVSIADPYVLLRMSDGNIQLLVGDPSTCTVSINIPAVFESSKKSISACTLYHDKGPEPWLRKTSTDAWLSTGIGEAIDGADGAAQDQGDIYCVVSYESGDLEIFDVPNFNCVFSVDKFMSGNAHLVDTLILEPSEDTQKVMSKNSEEEAGQGRKENAHNIKVVELAMQRWSGQHSRPFLFGILTDGTILCYHAYLYEGPESTPKTEEAVSAQNSLSISNVSASRLRNLRFVRVPLDTYTREEALSGTTSPRMTVFKNIGGCQGLFLSGSRPLWFMVFRERIRVHPQLCDGSIVAFTVLHNINCNHGLIYVTSQGFLKICQLPAVSSYDNYWPVQKIPLKGTPHQVTYFAEKNLYPLIVSVPVLKPLNHVLSSLVDQEAGHQLENDNLSSDELHRSYSVDEFEVRVLEPEKSGAPWQTRATIPMQSSENALTVRVVTLFNTATKENETLLAIGTAYVQGEDVAARGRVLLFSVGKNTDNSQNLVSEIYSKELKGAISALASLQGHLLIASGPKIILHKWTGTELNGVAFFDAPPLYVVSLNIVKNFILLGDIHRSIYFLSWKEQGAQLNLLAKDFGSLDCFATEFLIDGSTLSLIVSDDQKNIQIFYYAPKMSESWKGQKLLSRAEFHVGAHVTKFLRLQMLPASSDRTSATQGSDKTNRFALLFGTLDGSIGCIAPLDELTFRRLQSLQKKLVDAVPHVAGLNPRSFRQFRSNGKAHRPGPDNIVDCELLCHYEMLPFEEQLEIAQQIGTTRMQILSNLNDLSLGTSFL